MFAAAETEVLRTGLRALATLGREAPIDAIELANLIGTSPNAGETLLAVFESHGYAKRVPGGPIFVLTRLGSDLLGENNAAGRLVSEAIEPIALASQCLARPINLGLRRRHTVLWCIAAGAEEGLPRSGERIPISRDVAGLLSGRRPCDHGFCLLGNRLHLMVPVPLSAARSAVLSVPVGPDDDLKPGGHLFSTMRSLAHRIAVHPGTCSFPARSAASSSLH